MNTQLATMTAITEQERAVGALRAVILAVEHYRQTGADYFGLHVTDAQAISHLVEADLGGTELAARLHITTGAATALVDRLERAGLAERQADPADRRRSTIRLTDQGRRLVAEARSWNQEIFADVPTEELPTVTELLGNLAASLHRQAESITPRLQALSMKPVPQSANVPQEQDPDA